MAFRIQRFWKFEVMKKGKNITHRNKALLKEGLTLLVNTHQICKIKEKNMFIVTTFLRNTSNKILINKCFISWHEKIVTIQNYFRKCFRNNERFIIMKSYWNKITEVADWNIYIGNKLKKIKQYNLMKLATIPEEVKDTIIKEYLKHYTLDRYHNLKLFLDITNELPTDLKRLALLKFYIQKIYSDDIKKIERNKDFIDNLINKGFEDIFKSKKTRSAKKRKREKDEDIDEDKESIGKKELAVKLTLEELDKKLYGLIVPKSGNFIPDFFDMIRLMVSTN